MIPLRTTIIVGAFFAFFLHATFTAATRLSHVACLECGNCVHICEGGRNRSRKYLEKERSSIRSAWLGSRYSKIRRNQIRSCFPWYSLLATLTVSWSSAVLGVLLVDTSSPWDGDVLCLLLSFAGGVLLPLFLDDDIFTQSRYFFISFNIINSKWALYERSLIFKNFLVKK